MKWTHRQNQASCLELSRTSRMMSSHHLRLMTMMTMMLLKESIIIIIIQSRIIVDINMITKHNLRAVRTCLETLAVSDCWLITCGTVLICIVARVIYQLGRPQPKCRCYRAFSCVCVCRFTREKACITQSESQ